MMLVLRYRKRPKSLLKVIPKVGHWLPFLGHLLQLRRDTEGFVQDCIRKYGKIFKIRLGIRKIVVVADRELA
jgi:hypothetical protein